MKRQIPCCLLFILSSASICWSTVPLGYESYTEWDKLPQLRLGANSGLASSYDRDNANNNNWNSDWNYYESPEGQILTETTCTIKTIQGPGIIYRYWKPHCMSIRHYPVQMYFDGESTPRIDTFSDTIFDGLFSYFDAPFVTTCAGGQMSYEPVVVYLGLGSNLGNRQNSLDRALDFLSQRLRLGKVSLIYDTEPVGNIEQPRFLNLVCQAFTTLTATGLLTLVKGIERKLGRRPGKSNAPRPIDIDILFYGDQVIETPGLVIPHPRLTERAFVLIPLAEIAPDLVHPVSGETIK